MTAYLETQLHSILTSVTENGQFHVTASLPRRRIPRYPMNRRLGGPQSEFGRCREKQTIRPCQGSKLQFVCSQARSVVTTSTELTRLTLMGYNRSKT